MLQFNFKTIGRVSLVVAVIAATVIASCKKKNDTAGVSQFIGTWRGTACAHHDSLVIGSANNNYSVFVSKWVSTDDGNAIDTCGAMVKLLGSVSGNTNTNNFTMASETFVDACGNTYTLSGGASLVGDTLFISFVTMGANGTSVCNFKGYK